MKTTAAQGRANAGQGNAPVLKKVQAKLELLNRALKNPELSSAEYAAAFQAACELECEPSTAATFPEPEQWQWCKDYLETMSGNFRLDGFPTVEYRTASSTNLKLTIGIDVRCLFVESTRRRGIGRYVINLIRALARLKGNHELRLFGDAMPWDAGDVTNLFPETNVSYGVFHRNFARELDVFLLTDPLQLLTGYKQLPYDSGDTPLATIFYDLIPLNYPREYLGGNEHLFRQYVAALRALGGRISAYLPISEFVGQDLAQRCGVPESLIHPIMGGVDEVFFRDIHPATPAGVPYFIYAGGTDHRKNLGRLIEAFIRLRKETSRECKLVLVGDNYERWLEAMLEKFNAFSMRDDFVLTGYVSDEELAALYAGSVAFVFPSLHEGFGLPALEAMAVGCPVIAANDTSLKEIVNDAGLLADPLSTNEFTAAMRKLLADNDLRAALSDRGKLHARQYTWQKVAQRALNALLPLAKSNRRVTAPTRKLRVMIQNRPDAFTARGGDTVVMQQLYSSLCGYDCEVQVGCGKLDHAEFDLLHLINLTLPKVGELAVYNARRHRVPLVVTTLYEDWPRYLDKSLHSFMLFNDYIQHDYDEHRFREGLNSLKGIPVREPFVNAPVLDAAAALIACGETERSSLHTAFPETQGKVEIANFAVNDLSGIRDVTPEVIRRITGLELYVLCCGRIETRKNQLMLLKALEGTDIPLVLAGGGFSAQPEYVELVRNYSRRGPLAIMRRLDERTLVGLMQAAAVHVLPSWYELPGLVTLEAAANGIPVVASSWGAITDYLPAELIHLCEPDDPASIRAAVEAALNRPVAPELAKHAKSFTLDRFGQQTFEVYERTLTRNQAESQQRSATTTRHNSVQITTASEEQVMTTEKNTFDCSIIIPVHNRADLTQKCLEAISNSETNRTYEVIVVDNKSTDETPRLLEALEGDVKILRESGNRGFAVACNRGARLADGKHLVFLNNDTEPHSGWLDELCATAEQSENVGAVGARLLYPNGKLQHAGVAFNEEHIPFNLFQNFPGDHPAGTQSRDMQAVSAACMLVPAATYSQLGGMDETYKNGFEDVDLCLRMRERGLRVIYCAECVVTHHEESTPGRKQHDRENMNRFLARWEDTVQADDNTFANQHGFSIEWGESGGVYRELASRTSSTPKDTATLLDEANKKYLAGDYQDAVSLLQNVVEQEMTLGREDGFEAWQTLGNCFARLNNAEQAEQAYLKAIANNDKSDRPYLGLGSIAMLQENWTAAQYGFMAALAKNPDTTKGRFGIGVSLAARGNHREALEHFKHVVESEPQNAEAVYYLYRTAMELGEPEHALDPLETYLLEHPTDVDFLFHFCGLLWKLGELSRAVEICEQILNLDPEHADARAAMEHIRKTATEHV